MRTLICLVGALVTLTDIHGYFSTRRAAASTLATNVATHRPIDDDLQDARRTANLKAAELRDVAQRYLRPSQLRTVIMGDVKAIQGQLSGQRVEKAP